MACTIIGSETTSVGTTMRKRCCGKACGASYRPNFVWYNDTKLNASTFTQIRKAGVYFVTNNLGFTFAYLFLTYLRLVRANQAPGQEAAVRHLFNDSEAGGGDNDLMGYVSLRDNLLHALEGFVVARNSPDDLVRFSVDFPASFQWASLNMFVCPSPTPATSLTF